MRHVNAVAILAIIFMKVNRSWTQTESSAIGVEALQLLVAVITSLALCLVGSWKSRNCSMVFSA